MDGYISILKIIWNLISMGSYQAKISTLMSQKKMSYADIEKETGLHKSTVYGIVSGTSKNPGVNALQLIAKALGVSLGTILIDEEDIQHNPLSHNQMKAYSNATSITINIMIEKNLNFPMDKVLAIIKDVYQFSTKNGKGDTEYSPTDPRFIEWLLESKYNS